MQFVILTAYLSLVHCMHLRMSSIHIAVYMLSQASIVRLCTERPYEITGHVYIYYRVLCTCS